MRDRDFLRWLADRLVLVYHEPEGVGFVHKLVSIAEALPVEQETPSSMKKHEGRTMSENEVIRGTGSAFAGREALTGDEETCLLILAEGGYMAPIGRWQAPLESLAQRGLCENARRR